MEEKKISIEEAKKLESDLINKMILKARDNFETFVKLMAPVVLPEKFVDGVHIKMICEELQGVEESVRARTPKRIQLWLPPGSMKSKIASNLFPAWCLGRNPKWCFLAIGSDQDFAVDNFGRPTKELIESAQYQAIFPGTKLKKDMKSAGKWDTSCKGRFVAKGVGQNIAGRRAHISICDDVITEQTTDNDRKAINAWYNKGLRTRLLPNGAEIIINTRWFTNDLSAYTVHMDENSSRPWNVIKLPAILDEQASLMLKARVAKDDPRFAPGTSFWPEFWPTKLLLEKKETMDPVEWSALYLQEPVSVEGSIVKRDDWKIWTDLKPPKCRNVLVSVDTALSQKEAANPSAYTVWGVFTNVVKTFDDVELSQESMILLGSGQGRWDFSEMCQKFQELDNKFKPDYFIIEETSAGLLLIPELQKRGLPVLPFKPDADKTSRLQATTPYFRAGRIWIPDGKAWAEEVVQEVLAFQPRLKNQKDDFTDTVSQAIIWMRDHYKIDNDGYNNYWDEEINNRAPRTYWSSALTRK